MVLSYAISPAWTVTIYDSYARLVDDAADSPIVDDIGSEDQNVVGLSLEYAFHIGFLGVPYRIPGVAPVRHRTMSSHMRDE